MQVTIQSTYRLRDELISSYYSYPNFTPEIENRLLDELNFLIHRKIPFELEFKVSQK